MFADLCVLVPELELRGSNRAQNPKKKDKGNQAQDAAQKAPSFSPAQVAKLESHISLLVRLGYSVIGLTQVVRVKIDPKAFVNLLDPLIPQLKTRPRVSFVKRLLIVLTDESDTDFGLTNSNAALFKSFDILSIEPATQNAFSLACLSHSTPSTLTSHIISLPLTLPRLPYTLKHTLIRTAIKNGAVFEIKYAGAVSLQDSERRNWWATARELARVSKGKGLLVSSGTMDEGQLRAPRDVGNLVTFLGLPQDVAHAANTTVAKSLMIRAQTRKTYRAVLSEPKLVLPEPSPPAPTPATVTSGGVVPQQETTAVDPVPNAPPIRAGSKKRALGEDEPEVAANVAKESDTGNPKQKKRKKEKQQKR